MRISKSHYHLVHITITLRVHPLDTKCPLGVHQSVGSIQVHLLLCYSPQVLPGKVECHHPQIVPATDKVDECLSLAHYYRNVEQLNQLMHQLISN